MVSARRHRLATPFTSIDTQSLPFHTRARCFKSRRRLDVWICGARCVPRWPTSCWPPCQLSHGPTGPSGGTAMIGTHSYHTTPTNTTLHTQSSRMVISPDARVCASELHTASISRSRTSTSPTSRASPSLSRFIRFVVQVVGRYDNLRRTPYGSISWAITRPGCRTLELIRDSSLARRS